MRPIFLALLLTAALSQTAATCATKAPTCAEQLGTCAPYIVSCLTDCAKGVGCTVDACLSSPTPAK
jgi:hypothetical protein